MLDELEGYEPPQQADELEGYQPPKKKARPQKPTKIAPKQEFKVPIPPSITEGPPPSRLKFAKGSFREAIQAETPEEREKIIAGMEAKRKAREKRIAGEQQIYDVYGPTRYAIREGMAGLGSALAEPFTSAYREIRDIPEDIKAVFKGTEAVQQRQAEKRAEIAESRQSVGEGILRSSEEPLVAKIIPPAIEYGGQILPFMRFGRPTPLRPPAGRLGAPSTPIRPQRPRLPGAPPEAPPSTALEPLRLDRFNKDLVTGNIGPYQGGVQVAGMLSEGTPGTIGQPVADDFSFDLLPALRPGQSPVMIVPQWVIDAATNNTTGRIIEGITFDFDLAPGIISKLRSFAPSANHLTIAVKALGDAELAARAEGLNSIVLESQEVRNRRAIYESDREYFENVGAPIPPEIGSHETFHAGQYKAAEELLKNPDLSRLYDANWAANNPAIQEVIAKKPSWSPQDAAVELPSYVMGRQTLRYFNTTAEGIDHIFDSLLHLRDRFGDRALEILQTTTRVSPGLEDLIPLARSMYDNWQREREAAATGSSQLAGPGGGLQQATIGGVESRTGETGTPSLSREAPGISPADRGVSSERSLKEIADEAQREFSVVNDKLIQRENELLAEAIAIWEKGSPETFKSIIDKLEVTDPQKAEIMKEYEAAYFKWIRADADAERGRVIPEPVLSEESFSPGDKVIFVESPIMGQGEVIEAKGDIAKVRFAGGQTLSVAIQRLAKVPGQEATPAVPPAQLKAEKQASAQVPPSAVPSAPVTTPAPTPGQAPEGKIVPTLPGPMKIKGSSVNVAKMGPGDTPGKIRIEFADGTFAQFDINDVRDRRGRRIKDPILYMIVKDPPVIGVPQGPSKIPPPPPPPPGREGIPLYVPVVTNLATKRLTDKFSELLLSNDIEYDFTIPVSAQVYLATLAGKVRDDVVDQILGEEGISWEDFASDAQFSVSEAARTMARYSHVVRRHWLRLLKENPGLIQKAIPPATQIELMLDEMKRSVLGMTLWRRLGRDIQKALLTQYATAAVNFMSATVRIPADATSSVVGAMLQQVMEGEGTFEERLVRAREAAEATLQAHVEVVRALNPMQVEELSRGQLGTEYSEHEQIITKLEQYFPDIHSKLFARTYGEEAEALSKVEQYLPAAKLLLPRVKNEAKRRDLDRQLEKYSKRLKFEKSIIMYLPRKGEWLLDQILRPANFGEFLLRRPRFVGRLALELSDRGIDLYEIASRGALHADPDDPMTFKDIPEEALRAALSDALEFTMAYDPRTDKDASYVERHIAVPFIKIMNALGPLSLKITAFPRAMVSSFKTTMEYTPLPILAGWRENSPFRRVFWKETRKDPKTGAEYNPNPPTRGDYQRVGRALVGTFMLALAWKLIDEGILDEDGKKLKTPMKGPNKRPIYMDVERFKPISTHFRIAALLDRWHKGTMGDRNAANEIYEIITGMRRYEGDQDFIDLLDSAAEFAGGESDAFNRWNRTKEEIGRIFPAPFLTPLLNLRAVIAEVDADENLKKDLKGQGFWGPSIDKIPMLRRRLPNQVYPLEPGPVKLSVDPAAAGLAGFQFLPDQNTVGREFRRLGINIRSYLRADPDPIINREQNRMFEMLSSVIGGMKISEPEYQAATNDMKAAMLEDVILGDAGMDNGIVDAAVEAGQAANPMEIERRKLKGELPGRYRRKAVGLDKVLEVLQGVSRK